MAKFSKRASGYISMKMHKMKKEGGMTHNAMLGKAIGMARGKFGAGEVPMKKGRKKKR